MGRRRRPTRKEASLEVVDRNNKPVAAFPRSLVHEQQLLHRRVIVLLYNKKKKLYLQKRSRRKGRFPACWDISVSGHVYAGESCLEAALRKLRDEIGVSLSRLQVVNELQAGPETDHEFVTLFSTGTCEQVPSPNPADVEKGLFVEKHELDYLVRSFQHLLTPGLIYFWRLGRLFSGVSPL
jgi:isopentenyldiphosphate isomerase